MKESRKTQDPATSVLSRIQLREVLKSVSRSFYLSIRILPAPMRAPIAIAYLLARAADTIADTTTLLPSQRAYWLRQFRYSIADRDVTCDVSAMMAALTPGQANADERHLLQCLPQLLPLLDTLSLEDEQRVRQVVMTLCDGMFMDLEIFSDESRGGVAALSDAAALDRYIYLVAGCVGEFWTAMIQAHTPAAAHWDYARQHERGVSFGKALQLTNVLRDAGSDLRNGRCYLPVNELAAIGMRPEDLLADDASARARPLLWKWQTQALEYYDQAISYMLAIPRRCFRLRLAAIWPAAIGLATLARLAENPKWLNPGHASKVSRRSVYGMILLSLPLAFSNSMLRRWLLWLRQRAVRA